MKKAVLINDTRTEGHHGCNLVIENIIYLLKNRNINIIDYSNCNSCWYQNKKFLNNFNKADLIIVNGEGTIHHNQKMIATQQYNKNKQTCIIIKHSKHDKHTCTYSSEHSSGNFWIHDIVKMYG